MSGNGIDLDGKAAIRLNIYWIERLHSNEVVNPLTKASGDIVKKSLVITLIKYGLGIAVLTWVLVSNWDGLDKAFRNRINYTPLLIAVGLCLAALLLTFYRWYILVRAQDLPFAVSDAMRLGFVGFALSTVLPTSIGGDVIKAAFLAREQNRRTIAVATVVFDRIIGLCGLFWVVAVVGAVLWITGYLQSVLLISTEAEIVLLSIVYASWVVTAVCLFFWIGLGFVPRRWIEPFAVRLAGIPKVGEAIAELWRAVWIYRSKGRSVAVAVALAFVGHLGFVLVFYFAALSVTPIENIPGLNTHYLIVPMGIIIQAGFPAPGGVGGGEFAFGQLYRVSGFAVASGVLASLMFRIIHWGLAATGYIVYLRMKPALQKEVERIEPGETQTAQLSSVEA